MQTRYSQQGFTIIETMIFLTISVVLFTSVVATMAQQNRRTQFVQSVDTMQQKLQDVLNDVSTGYYPSASSFNCVKQPSAKPLINTGSTEQGANEGCIFIGKAIQFSPSSGKDTYSVYTILGNRRDTSLATPVEVTNVVQSKPRLLGATDPYGLIDINKLSAGVKITKVVSLNGDTEIGGVGVISDFSTTTGHSVTGNASRVSLARLLTTSLDMDKTAFATAVDENNATNIDLANVDKGVVVCLSEGAGGRHASLTIGGNNEQLSLTRTIDSWPGVCD